MNHYLRIDGTDGLYFLRGTPPSSHATRNCAESTPTAASRWSASGTTRTAI
jgi:hypothetical protein